MVKADGYEHSVADGVLLSIGPEFGRPGFEKRLEGQKDLKKGLILAKFWPEWECGLVWGAKKALAGQAGAVF